jgi:hypothetical protein
MRRRRPQLSIRPGFTITEILLSLSLLTLFFAFSGEVFKSTVLLSSAGQDVCNRSNQIDFVLRQLRADVWNCRSMSLANPQSIELSTANAAKISWKIDSQNSLIRTDPAGREERYDVVATHWSFSADKVSLLLSDGASPPNRMISQILLSKSEQP